MLRANPLLPSGVKVINLPHLLGDIRRAAHNRCQTRTFQDQQAIGRKDLDALYAQLRGQRQTESTNTSYARPREPPRMTTACQV